MAESIGSAGRIRARFPHLLCAWGTLLGAACGPAMAGQAAGAAGLASADGAATDARAARAAGTGEADIPVDDFELAGAPSPWAFSNGPEFPGARGTLGVTQEPSASGHAARLEGDFSAGGNYVSAGLALARPVSAPLLAFRARASAGSHIVVRVVDSTGQTLQYSLPRPLEAPPDPQAWYPQVVDLGAPSLAFGGAADMVPHPPFKRLEILLEALKFRDQAAPYEPLRLDFDEVAFLGTRGESLDPAATPLPFAGGGTTAGLGINIHFTRNDAALDALKGSGIAWLRMDLYWSGIEAKKGVYDFSADDALVASALSRGLKVHFILGYANPLYESGPPRSAAALAAFRAFAQATAAHFQGKAGHFEVWNEPNLAGSWDPVDAGAYAAACAAAIAGIHAGNPAAQVATAGVSEVDWPFVGKVLAAGGGAGADAIGVHPYRGDYPEALIDQILLLKDVVRDAYAKTGAPAPPLWDTEWGYTSTDFGGRTAAAWALQARHTVRRILASWAIGFPFFVLYDLMDDGDDPANREHNFGILNRDLSDKPAMTAVRALAERTKGFAAKGFLPLRESGAHALKLESGAEILIVLWRHRAGELKEAETKDSLLVAFGARPTGAWDMSGRPLPLPAEAGGKTAFLAGLDPIYVTFPKGGNRIQVRRRNSRVRLAMGRAGVFPWGDAERSAAGRTLVP